MSRVPIVLLGGFLGSGKTTLLVNLMKESKDRGLKPSVLVNEKGKIDIDGKLVSETATATETLLDGCICCSKKSEIASSIDSLLHTRPDIIFIELTGVANVEEVINALSERELIAKVELKSVIIVMDAEYVLSEKSSRFRDEILGQLGYADLITVNKMDLISESDVGNLNNLIKEKNTLAEIEHVTFGNINFDKVFQFSFEHNLKSGEPKRRKQVYTNMTTIALPVDYPVTKKKVENFLLKHGDCIIRAKGFIPVQVKGMMSSYLFQYSGVNRVQWIEEKSDRYYLILIGVNLDDAQLKEDWMQTMQTESA